VIIVNFFVCSVLAALSWGAVAASVEAATLYGPVLGDSEMSQIKIWVQTDSAAEVKLSVQAKQKAGASVPLQPRSFSLKTQAEKDFTQVFDVNGLQPGTDYTYALWVNGEAVKRSHPFTFSTAPYWQKRSDPPTFTFALGSCAYINDPALGPATSGGDYGIFQQIYQKKPEMMLWMGDNIYMMPPDFYSRAGMSYRYQQSRALKELQPLFANVPQYAIWDDHDYGNDNGDRSYRMREDSLAMFKRYWPNPSFGLPTVPGVFTRFEKSDVEFFLTDNRYHRAPNALADPKRDFFGPEQWQWLKESLSSSDATFKFIVLGNETLNTLTPSENMYQYTQAYQDFLQWLESSKISGIVLLSGDRHHTELLKLERPGSYPLYEWCVSPLTSKAYPPYPVEQNLPVRVPGSLYSERNFGMVEVTGPPDNRQLVLKRYNVKGQENWRFVIKANDLIPKQ
jgi:alkaline phosphatase D